MKIEKLGKYISEVSVRNKNLLVTEVFSVTNSQGFLKSTDYFNKEVFSKDISNYKIVSQNQFAYNPSRINVGSIDYLKNHSKVIISPLYVVFKCENELDQEFLKVFLKSPEGISKIKNKAKGTVRDTLSFGSLSEIKIPILPLSVQLHIANLLTKAETLIAQRKQSIALLDECLKSTYCELFTKYEGKTIQPLESIASITSGLTKGKKYEGKTTRFLPYMRVANVQDGFLNLQEIKEIEATEDEITRFNLRFGDLLLTEGGDPDKLGRGTTWKNQIKDCIFQNHIFRVRINDIKKIDPVFLSYQTGSIYGKKYFLKSAKQTTGIASINSTQLKKFPVFIPPFELQTQFSKIVEKVEALKVQYQNSLQELENLYGSLSQQAFQGELTINQAKEQVLMAAEPEPIYGKVIEFASRKCNSTERAILAGHIINKTNKEDFGRVKFQKLLHLTTYHCKIDIDSNFTKKVAGPHDGDLLKDIESTLKRYRFYNINQSNKGNHKVNYTPLSSVSELEEIFDSNFESERERIDSFLAKFRKSSWEQCEIISTLYAVWNNRLILNQEITDELLKQDFLDWDAQKVKYIGRLDDALKWMKTKGVIPDGCGKLIE